MTPQEFYNEETIKKVHRGENIMLADEATVKDLYRRYAKKYRLKIARAKYLRFPVSYLMIGRQNTTRLPPKLVKKLNAL